MIVGACSMGACLSSEGGGVRSSRLMGHHRLTAVSQGVTRPLRLMPHSADRSTKTCHVSYGKLPPFMRACSWQQLRQCASWAFALGTLACGGGTSSSPPTAPSAPASTISSSPTPVGPAAPTGPARYVTIGFWQDATCSGTPNATNAFPLHYDPAQCFASPGRSGENSVSQFACGQDSFSYTQWTTLTCSGGQVPAGTRKIATVGGCTQGVPPTQYARILDFSGCRTAP